MKLIDSPVQKEHIIKNVDISDDELKGFLFSLGCYIGEPITVLNRFRSGCIVALKDSRYSIDNRLQRAIIV